MPPLWLLSKPRVSHDESRGATTQPGKSETIQTPRWDDFCFADNGVPPIRGAQDEERPKTSSGVSRRDRSKSRTRRQIDLTVTRPMTSERRSPLKPDVTYTPTKLDGDMIGVAFGSPTHPPTHLFGTLNDLAPASTYEESLFEQPEPMYQIKGRTSKWKKLGSLFKGGRATSDKDDLFEVPFYKVRIEDDTSEVDVKPPVRKPVEDEIERARKSPTPPPKDNRRRSIDERLAQARLEVARLEEVIAEAEKKKKTTADQMKEVLHGASHPKLDLVIPDITMDRYSVMFADLKEIPPYSKLLARRSKKLGRLKPISTEDMKQLDEVATPDTSTLSPRIIVPRRATSPSATKTTAGFSLFPAATLTPNHVTKQTLATPSPRAPLKRAATSPARLSPRVETFNDGKPKATESARAENARGFASPGDTSASTDREAPWSAEAFLSPTSTITTIDEDMLLEMSPVTSKSTIAPFENPATEPDPAANEARHIQFFASPTLPQDVGDTPEANTPVMTTDPSQDDDYKIRRVASSVFDQAIAEIEAFGMPSLQESPPLPSPPSAFVPFVLAPEDTKAASNYTEKVQPAISKSRLMMMNMPSPIREASEESPAPSPAKHPRLVSEVTAPPRISEASRLAPPATASIPSAASHQSNVPRPSDKIEAQSSTKTPAAAAAAAAAAATIPSTKRKIADQSPKASPEKTKTQSNHMQKNNKHETQTALSKEEPRSKPRMRTTDKAARVLGEVLPAPQHKMAIIAGQTPDTSTAPADEAPPVPTKDSKFAPPLSRFAVKGTAAEVAHKSGLKASSRFPSPKPVRSVTEPLTTLHTSNVYPKSKPSRLARSASDESLQREITNPAAHGTATTYLERTDMEKPNVITVMATVKPAPLPRGGEVGVARTVSVSRKPSQRILVKRTDLARDTSPEAKQEQAQKMQARATDLRPPRSSSRPKRPLNNLKRSESFKRAIEVGMDDDEEGDMRSGELRARAMSPEMREVTTGLVVNGHKVMKSSVGVIEEA